MKFTVLTQILLVVAMMTSSSCDDRGRRTDENSGQGFYQQAKPVISSVQQYLVNNMEWLNVENLSEFQKRDLKVTSLFASLEKSKAVASEIPTQIEINGIMYDVAIELANKDNVEEFSKRMAKGLLPAGGVAPDPDLDPIIEGDEDEPEQTITIQVLRQDNSIESLTFMNAEYRQELDFDTTGIILQEEYAGLGLATAYNQQVLSELTYPLFYVTLQEQDPAVASKSAGFQKSVASGSASNPWLEIHQINLYVKNDNGDEEFELYYGELWDSLGNHSAGSYVDGKYSRGVMFNGSTRVNPEGSGRSVYFRNVNKPGEKFSDPILIQKLFEATENRSGIIAFVDNDYMSQYIYRNWNAGSGYYKKNLWASNIRDGKHKVRTEYFQTYQKSGINQDDPYRDEVIGITAGNVNKRILLEGKNEFAHKLKTNTLGQLNSDMSVKFKRGYWSY